MKPVSISSKKTLFKNDLIEMYSVHADFGAVSREYFVTKRGTRVGVILTKGDSVLLVSQYRFVINNFSWELPSGGVDEGETLEEAAARECIEEAGMCVRSLSYVFDFILNPDVMDCKSYIYSSTDFSASGDYDRHEISETRWFTKQECMSMIFSKEIKDIFTVLGLFTYFRDIG